MALGKILRENREQQGYSAAQVAEATHMMVQIVEELEREDFQRIAAPIYGRGFVKLYAEFPGIDPVPLVKEFSEIFSGSRRPVIATRPVTPAPSSETRGEGSGFRVQDSGEGSGVRVQGSGVEPDEPTLSRALSTGAAEPAGTAGTIDPNQPRSTPLNPELPNSRTPELSNSRPPSPSRVSDELDDLFGLRPSSAPERREALSVERSASSVERSPRPPSPTTHFSPLRALRALRGLRGKKYFSASALKSALPARWRSGPVLAGTAAGLLVIAAVVILVTRSSSSSSGPGKVERIERIDGIGSVDSGDSLDHSPLTTHHSPLTIRTVLPPPEPYID